MTAIPKRTRYEVLRRDNFTCRYCGAKPPDVKLNVDAVVPDVLGGSHKDPANLVAACEACNGGKSSSAPDAPLVAEVSDRALVWAQAMREAQAKMLADIEARTRDRVQFSQWWDGWKRVKDDEQTSIPKDPAWWVTIDQLLSAGLPLAALRECIDLAMTQRKVQDENRFRYMCGVAWNKVKELQKSARAITSGGAPAEGAAEEDPFEEGRLSLARELLDEISEEERAYFLDLCDMTRWQDEDDEPQAEAQQACEAVASLLNTVRCNLDWVVQRLKTTLEGLPPEIGEGCLAAMQTEKAATGDPHSQMASGAVSALYALEDLVDLPAATAYMDGLHEQDRLEWIEYAHALYPNAELSPERWLVRAWACAEVVTAGNHYKAMCGGRGARIQGCPTRGAYHALIAELKCCGPDRAEDHQGHTVCERHLEQLMDGTFIGQDGKPYTAADFAEIPAAKDVWAPF